SASLRSRTVARKFRPAGTGTELTNRGTSPKRSAHFSLSSRAEPIALEIDPRRYRAAGGDLNHLSRSISFVQVFGVALSIAQPYRCASTFRLHGIQQSEEQASAGSPGEDAVGDLSCGAHDLAGNVDDRVKERTEVHS